LLTSRSPRRPATIDRPGCLEVQLRDEPLRETRNRKLLRPNPMAAWELRVGPLRIFYEVDAEEADVVNVLAIGIKTGNRLFIAGEEMRI